MQGTRYLDQRRCSGTVLMLLLENEELSYVRVEYHLESDSSAHLYVMHELLILLTQISRCTAISSARASFTALCIELGHLLTQCPATGHAVWSPYRTSSRQDFDDQCRTLGPNKLQVTLSINCNCTSDKGAVSCSMAASTVCRAKQESKRR